MPTLVAVVGLLVALVFNTVGVWLQVGQARQAQKNTAQARKDTAQSRKDTALGLLTQLNGVARQAEARLVGARRANCAGDPLTARDRAALIEAAQDYEYLAWLFNGKHIPLPTARPFWAPSMIETYELVKVEEPTAARRRLANLREFKRHTPEEQWPPPTGSDC